MGYVVGAEPWEAPDGAPTAEDITILLVARDADGHAVACGALRRLDAISAEIKRMFVLPGGRGNGAATAVLRALELAARSLGLGELKLEPGTAQPDAIRFYEREGYRLIENFGPYLGAPISVCYARTL